MGRLSQPKVSSSPGVPVRRAAVWYAGHRERTVGGKAAESDHRHTADQEERVAGGDRASGPVPVRDLPVEGVQ
jgi:hypothetical protein